MAAYRCHNGKCSTDPHGRLIFDFEVADGAPPICPSCGADYRNPRHCEFVLTKLEVIHFETPSGIDGIGSGYVACYPEKSVRDIEQATRNPDYCLRRTASPEAVNCKKCRETAEFATALEVAGIPKELEKAEVDLKASLSRMKKGRK